MQGRPPAVLEDGSILVRVPVEPPSKTPAESVRVRSPSTPWLSLTGYLGSAFELLATLAFALVLLVFFLLGREDLRDRVVLLAGKARLTETPPAIICIASLPPGGLSHARYLCRRLRDASPHIEIIVGRWGRQRNIKLDRERLEQAGANFVTMTLLETRRLLESRLPLLTRETPTAFVSKIPEPIAGAGRARNVPTA